MEEEMLLVWCVGGGVRGKRVVCVGRRVWKGGGGVCVGERRGCAWEGGCGREGGGVCVGERRGCAWEGGCGREGGVCAWGEVVLSDEEKFFQCCYRKVEQKAMIGVLNYRILILFLCYNRY